MIPLMQTISASGWGQTPDGKPEIHGDCVRACVASILERPLAAVPHFVAGEVLNDAGKPMDWYSGLNMWLEREGYACRAAYKNYMKHIDVMMAWRKERDASGVPNSPMDTLWMYDPPERVPYHHGYWIGGVISENFAGGTHAIVMRGGDVVHDPSPHPRRTPYQFVGETIFTVEDPAVCWRVERAQEARAA